MALAWITAAKADTNVQSTFTSYFGSKINGAEVQWWNSPDSETAADAAEMRFKITQNLHTRQFTYWSSGDTDDAKIIYGDSNYYQSAADVSPWDLAARTTAYTAVTASTLLDWSSADIGYTKEDNVFHLQIT